MVKALTRLYLNVMVGCYPMCCRFGTSALLRRPSTTGNIQYCFLPVEAAIKLKRLTPGNLTSSRGAFLNVRAFPIFLGIEIGIDSGVRPLTSQNRRCCHPPIAISKINIQAVCDENAVVVR